MTKRRGFNTLYVEPEPIVSKAKIIKTFENANVNVELGKRRLKIPGDVVQWLKRLHRLNDCFDYWRSCSWLIEGPEGCQHKQWTKAQGIAAWCEPYVKILEYAELLILFGTREGPMMRTMNVRLLGSSPIFKKWQSANFPRRGMTTTMRPAGRQKLVRNADG